MIRKIGHALVCFSLTALPLGGVVVFSKLTQSASTHLGRYSNMLTGNGGLSVIPGVNAQLAEVNSPDRVSKLSAARSAGRAVAEMRGSEFRSGMQLRVMSEDGRVTQVTIVGRELLSDQEIPLWDRSISVDLASSARGGTFFDGMWRYTFEIEELGARHISAVQSSL